MTKEKLLQEAENSNGHGILRKLMSSEEIKLSNQLVKDGYFVKGVSDTTNGTVTYFITEKGKELN
jgi:DNA-binding HxlR family transcriptional regulator